MSVLNLFFVLCLAILTGVAVDVANVVSARTQLQVAADAAAHAALVQREWNTADVAKAKAIEIATRNMPTNRYGETLAASDIQFGKYNRTTGVFTIDNTRRDAVLVETKRLQAKGNAVTTFLLKLVGVANWNLRSQSVFETYRPTCLVEGFVGQDVVDIQSNNSYFNGFCIHSNAHVEINQNNFFQAGTIVSMPDKDDLVVPQNGLDPTKNQGLMDALREGRMFIKILNRLDQIVAGVQNQNSRYARSYITNYNVLAVTKSTVNPGDFVSGRIYKISCTSKLTFNVGIYQSLVIIANCPMQFKNGTQFRDAVIITTDTSAKAMYAPNNLILGTPDNCAPGGDAQMVSYGGFEVASSLEMHGSQVIAAGNVEFAANADGIRGASIVAGGRVDGTSNMNFAFCGSGMERSFEAEYFRLAY